tara:strand:+ start:4778 stop:4951 length:174 start_codon:yes stop_codon:yes gene_type:complete
MKDSNKNYISRRKFFHFLSLSTITSLLLFKIINPFEEKNEIIISKEGWILSITDYDI